ncbi:MAG TPA: nuclease-related domain-containing protein [Micromonosporaceae bacterium]
MRVVVLSDHGGQQLRRSRERLRAAESNLIGWQKKHSRASQDLRGARRAKPIWRRIFFLSTAEERDARGRVEEARRQIHHADQAVQQADNRIRQQSAGAWGEDALAEALSYQLSDDWVLLRGYRNRRGETDHLLVGPTGLWAVEVKYRRIRINFDRREWWYEKLDAYGNVVDTGWAVDGRDRTWDRQVNEVAGDLATWLRRNGHQVWVHTAVMVMHEDAQLGPGKNTKVSVVGTRPKHLLDAIAQRGDARLSRQVCQEIVSLVQRDHRHHNRRDERRR